MQTYDWLVRGKSGQEAKLISYYIIFSQNVPKHDLMLLAKSKISDKNMSYRTAQNLVTFVHSFSYQCWSCIKGVKDQCMNKKQLLSLVLSNIWERYFLCAARSLLFTWYGQTECTEAKGQRRSLMNLKSCTAVAFLRWQPCTSILKIYIASYWVEFKLSETYPKNKW